MSLALFLEYESAFQNLYPTRHISQASLENLQSFYHATSSNPELRPNMEKIIEYVEANPGKLLLGASLAACTWLVYHSADIGARIEKFIRKQKHRQLDELNVPRLDQLYGIIRGILVTAEEDPAQVKASFHEVFKGLTEFYRKLQSVMDSVEDTIDVPRSKMAAVKTTATYGCTAILAAFGFMVESESRINPIPVLWWKRAMLSTAACSCVFMFISLKKIYDLSVALEEQDNLKRRMQLLRDQYVNQFTMDFVEFS